MKYFSLEQCYVNSAHWTSGWFEDTSAATVRYSVSSRNPWVEDKVKYTNYTYIHI